MPAKFVLSKARGGKFRFELVASNGKVLAQSTPHDTKRAAVSALRSVQKNAATEVVDDQTEPAKKATATKAAATKTTASKSTAGKTTARKATTRKTATGQAAATSASATTKPLATARKTTARKTTTLRKRVAATGAAARATRA